MQYPKQKLNDTPFQSTARRPFAKRQLQSRPCGAQGEDRKAEGRSPVPWITGC